MTCFAHTKKKKNNNKKKTKKKNFWDLSKRVSAKCNSKDEKLLGLNLSSFLFAIEYSVLGLFKGKRQIKYKQVRQVRSVFYSILKFTHKFAFLSA
jgi:hypothetical protein